MFMSLLLMLGASPKSAPVMIPEFRHPSALLLYSILGEEVVHKIRSFWQNDFA
jgi:hypothetical protein